MPYAYIESTSCYLTISINLSTSPIFVAMFSSSRSLVPLFVYLSLLLAASSLAEAHDPSFANHKRLMKKRSPFPAGSDLGLGDILPPVAAAGSIPSSSSESVSASSTSASSASASSSSASSVNISLYFQFFIYLTSVFVRRVPPLPSLLARLRLPLPSLHPALPPPPRPPVLLPLLPLLPRLPLSQLLLPKAQRLST